MGACDSILRSQWSRECRKNVRITPFFQSRIRRFFTTLPQKSSIVLTVYGCCSKEAWKEGQSLSPCPTACDCPLHCSNLSCILFPLAPIHPLFDWSSWRKSNVKALYKLSTVLPILQVRARWLHQQSSSFLVFSQFATAYAKAYFKLTSQVERLWSWLWLSLHPAPSSRLCCPAAWGCFCVTCFAAFKQESWRALSLSFYSTCQTGN